ncbi:MAG: hypothetical protein OIF47_01920 [Marinibacterium sp.]|nr:hypothetical protein [Marinibacterium sp.]
MQPAPVQTQDTAIGQVLTKFAAGDMSLFQQIADDVDFRIDHFRDSADTSWQQASSRDALMGVLGRLAQDVFPQGTRALGITCTALGDGWHLTRFHQAFHYGLEQRDVTSLTYILSHEADGVVDYFRETVTGIADAL